jgi:hypothetical protein
MDKFKKEEIKTLFHLIVIIISITTILILASALNYFLYGLINERSSDVINKLGSEKTKELDYSLFMGILIGCFIGALISKMLMILKKEELNK